MPRSIRTRLIVPAVACFAALAGPVAIAQASDNDLRATLNAYSPKIVKDETAVKKGLNQYPKGKSKPLVRALTHEISDLHALNKTLKKESSSSSAGAKAKKDIVKGLGLIATAYGALKHDIQAVHGGAVPPSKVTAAIGTDKKGRTKLLAGLHLLGA